MDDLSCTIYLRPNAPPNDMKEFIARLTGGAVIIQRTVQTDALQIDVFQNKQGTSMTEDFVLWPFYLEVESAAASVTRDAFIDGLRALLQGLRENHVDAIPACDFEDELA